MRALTLLKTQIVNQILTHAQEVLTCLVSWISHSQQLHEVYELLAFQQLLFPSYKYVKFANSSKVVFILSTNIHILKSFW